MLDCFLKLNIVYMHKIEILGLLYHPNNYHESSPQNFITDASILVNIPLQAAVASCPTPTHRETTQVIINNFLLLSGL